MGDYVEEILEHIDYELELLSALDDSVDDDFNLAELLDRPITMEDMQIQS